MPVVICQRVEGRYFTFGVGVGLVPNVYVMWAITRVQVMLSSTCSLVSFCGVVNSCAEIIMYVIYVVWLCMDVKLWL
jgi:hypothetical protein